MNFVAREPIGIAQKALHEAYSIEERRKADLVDYALLDTMHETKHLRYGKANKPRELEPNMFQMLTGGYVVPEEEFCMNNKYKVDTSQMTEEELKLYNEALMRKEIAKGKWMTETRDNFRKFTDEPNENTYYIGHQLALPKKLANIYEGHYKTSYKRDFGEVETEDETEKRTEEDQEAQEVEGKKRKAKSAVRSGSRQRSGSRSGSRSKGDRSSDKIRERKKTPKKKRKKDIKKWIYERNKAKYGKPMIDKSTLTKEEREELERIEREISLSRWKADTHTRSLHGKPIWHAYGNKNTNPTVGGVVYGQYLLTHNIHPHSGDNCPTYQQVYTSAHNHAFDNGKPILEPTKELTKPEEIPEGVLEEMKGRNPIMPGEPSRHLKRDIEQLDLMREVCFASKHSETDVSEIASNQPRSINRIPRKQPAVKKQERPVPPKVVKKAAKTQPQKPLKSSLKQKTLKASQKPANAEYSAAQPIQFNAKDTAVKDVGTKKSLGMQRTMASTQKQPLLDQTNKAAKMEFSEGEPSV